MKATGIILLCGALLTLPPLFLTDGRDFVMVGLLVCVAVAGAIIDYVWRES